MKLLYFLPLLSTKGGIERTIIDKANCLVSRGHEVMVLTYEHDGSVAYQLDSRIIHEDLDCHFFTIYKYPFFLRLHKAIEIKRQFRIKMRDVLSKLNPDLIVITLPNTENYICDVMVVADDIPVVVESHLANGYQVAKLGIIEKLLQLIYRPLHAIQKARLMISLTTGDANCWQAQNVQRVTVIPNPLTIYPNQMPVMVKAEGRIICVGRLTPQKNFGRMIDAFSMIATKFPMWHVDIFGEGEGKGYLQQKIANLGLVERIIIHPATCDIYKEYQCSQFLVLSSDFEGFGLVIVEAMACGIPVVATDCPFGPSEIVEDGKTGLLAKMDVKDLATKMEWMITHEKERRIMGENAYNSAARYKKEIVIPKWEKTYMSVIPK